MKPYFESKHCVLYHGDCLEIMPELPKVDLVLTDPPYGIRYLQGKGEGVNPKWRKRHINVAIEGDDKKFDPRPLLLAAPHLVMWGANNYADLLPASRGWFVWDKKPDLGSNDLGDGELAWTNRDKVLRCFRHRWSGVIRDSQNGQKVNHPSEKPVALMEWCMSFFPDAQTVLDPYMGSSPVGIACINTNRQYIGIEIDEAYAEIAAKRIERAEIDAAQNLFLEPETATPVKQEVMPL